MMWQVDIKVDKELRQFLIPALNRYYAEYEGKRRALQNNLGAEVRVLKTVKL